MDTVRVILQDNKFICEECKNENVVAGEWKIGEVVECEYCGIEYRVVEIREDGAFVLELLEEEK
jgi:transcription elongation factor Elf1